MTATITIVRHGNTFEPDEPPRRIGARTDLPLTASGRAQAAALAAVFVGTRFDRAFVSPLLRTRATAAAILAARPDAPAAETAEWLAEIDHGPDEGRDEAEVIARIGADALARWDADAVPPDGWIVGGAARTAAWRTLFAAMRDGERLLAVTSNGAARFAPRAVGLRPSPGLKLRTGAWGTIAIDGGCARLVAWDVRP